MPAPTSTGLWPRVATSTTEFGNAAWRLANAARFGHINRHDRDSFRRALDAFSWTIDEVVAVARQLRRMQAPAALWLHETVDLLRDAEEIDADLLARLDILAWALGQVP